MRKRKLAITCVFAGAAMSVGVAQASQPGPPGHNIFNLSPFNLSAPDTRGFSDSFSSAGPFTDEWNFQLNSDAGLDASSIATVIGPVGITNLSLSLFYLNPPTYRAVSGPDTKTSFGFAGRGSYVDTATVASPSALPAGDWSLIVTGSVIGACGGSYGGTLDASPAAVPLPGSYAMFLAGLGLLGFLARRGTENAAA